MNKSLLICLTPVRNEAWILRAFLEATSIWADHIIVADQMSTDGSREIALSYPKVILIDNNNADFNESERQSLLINRAREIKGDKILFALDTDEIFAANFRQTKDWEKIINSIPGDVFWFKWAQVMPDKKHYWITHSSFPWVFHDDGIEPHGNYARNIHSIRIPYPIDEKQMYYVEDFKVLHFQHIFPERNKSKQRFYMFVDYSLNKRSIVKLSRTYLPKEVEEHFDILLSEMIYEKENGFDIFDLIDLRTTKFWFDLYVAERINQKGIDFFRSLDIWDYSFLKTFNYNDPRLITTKILHLYLRLTQNYSNYIVIKAIDKFLKKLGL